ncbi:MAG TPA: hypothetical protein VJV78_06140 [Polyangiales bacterium]|nr:hypothetical protein [Polyangiales bacterium]
MSGRLGLALLLFVSAAVSCVLPDFEKVEDDTNDPSRNKSDSGPDDMLTCPVELPLGSSCRKCIAANCCDQAKTCAGDACGADIRLPINPLTQVNDKFDALASCMLQHCDTEDTCNVRWGCVDNYIWPSLKRDHPFSMRVFNYADPREVGLPGVKVRMCESSDPLCAEGSGYVTTGTTDASGNVDFTAPKGFNGYFQLSGGSPAPATVQWSQPVYDVVDSFNHQALTPTAVAGLAVTVGLHTRLDEPFEPNTGHLIARMQNCLPLRYLDSQDPDRAGRARDVTFRFTPNGGATKMYYVNDMATLDTALDRTSWRGYAGAFQVPPTNVTVTAKHAVTGQQLASGTLTIRDGTIGFMYLVPNTSP